MNLFIMPRIMTQIIIMFTDVNGLSTLSCTLSFYVSVVVNHFSSLITVLLQFAFPCCSAQQYCKNVCRMKFLFLSVILHHLTFGFICAGLISPSSSTCQMTEDICLYCYPNLTFFQFIFNVLFLSQLVDSTRHEPSWRPSLVSSPQRTGWPYLRRIARQTGTSIVYNSSQIKLVYPCRNQPHVSFTFLQHLFKCKHSLL